MSIRYNTFSIKNLPEMGLSDNRLFDQVAEGSRMPFLLVEWKCSQGLSSLFLACASLQAIFHTLPLSPCIHYQTQAYTH